MRLKNSVILKLHVFVTDLIIFATKSQCKKKKKK